jgi:hypothetical protein
MLDYYSRNDIFQQEYEDAFFQFFGEGKALEFLETRVSMTDMEETVFDEWFLFEFRLEDGYTPLEHCIAVNPLRLSEKELLVYRELKQGFFDMFEVLEVRAGEILSLRSLRKEKTFLVYDRSGSESLLKGDWITARIGKRNKTEYEIIGGAVLKLPVAFGPGMQAALRKEHPRLTLLDVRELFFSNTDTNKKGDRSEKSKKAVSLEESERRLAKLLSENGMSGYIDVPRIRRLLEENGPIDSLAVTALLIGLVADEKREVDSYAVSKKLTSSLSDFSNALPKRFLGGKSSAEAKNEALNRNESDCEVIDRFDINEWGEYYEKGLAAFKRNDKKGALKEYREAFASLLRHQTTYRAVFRLFANMGTALLADGNEYAGLWMLRKAQQLNPQYDFAKRQLKRYEEGEFDFMVKSATLSNIKDSLEDKRLPGNRWDLYEIEDEERWPTEKIIRKLKQFGISVSKSEFSEWTKNTYSASDVAEQFLYPRYQGSDDDEDFVWMATLSLWKRWTPDAFCQEIFSDWLYGLETLLEEQGSRKTWSTKRLLKATDYLAHTERLFREAPDVFFDGWKELSGQYQDDMGILEWVLIECLHHPDMRSMALSLLDAARTRLKHPFLESVRIVKLYTDGDARFRTALQETSRNYPYDAYVYLDLFFEIPEGDEHRAIEEELLEKALCSVKEREKLGMFDLPYRSETIYEDYEAVFSELLDRYAGTGKYDEIDREWLSVQERKEILDTSPLEEDREKHFSKMMNEINQKRLEKEPGYQYAQFLEPFGICFDHPLEVPTQMTVIRADGRKIGRNEPCYCGSGKKFKKCCGG